MEAGRRWHGTAAVVLSLVRVPSRACELAAVVAVARLVAVAQRRREREAVQGAAVTTPGWPRDLEGVTNGARAPTADAMPKGTRG